MTPICRGLNVGDGKSRAAVRMAATLGPSDLGDYRLGATPTPAGGAVGIPERVIVSRYREPFFAALNFYTLIYM